MNEAIATRRPVSVKAALSDPNYSKRIQELLGSRSPQFCAALVQVCAANERLQKCDPSSVIGSAITAACLDLSLDPNLGEAYLVPYGEFCQFQLGYKGLTALCLRSGQFLRLGWVVVYEGELKEWDELEGNLTVEKKNRVSNKIIGYAAKFTLLNGFTRGSFWTVEEVKEHASTYSQSYKQQRKESPWFSNFDGMALKTTLKDLLSHWAPKSVQMQQGIKQDQMVMLDAETGKPLDNTDGGSGPSEPKFLKKAAPIASDSGNQRPEPATSTTSPAVPFTPQVVAPGESTAAAGAQAPAEKTKATAKAKPVEKPAGPTGPSSGTGPTGVPSTPAGASEGPGGGSAGTPASDLGPSEPELRAQLDQFLADQRVPIPDFLGWLETTGRCKDASSFETTAQVPLGVINALLPDTKGLHKLVVLYGSK